MSFYLIYLIHHTFSIQSLKYSSNIGVFFFSVGMSWISYCIYEWSRGSSVVWLKCLNMNPFMFDTCVHSPHLKFLGLTCKQRSSYSALSFFSFCLTCSHLIWLILLCASPARLCSFVFHFYLDLSCLKKMCTPPFFPASWNILLYLIFSAIRPRQRAGTIQRWQNCTKHWVSSETIKAPSCSVDQNPDWAAATPVVWRCWASALKALSCCSLRDLYLDHLRDDNSTVINLRGSIYQCSDCFPLNL